MFAIIESLEPILQALSPAYTQPSLQTHLQVFPGWIMCPGRRTEYGVFQTINADAPVARNPAASVRSVLQLLQPFGVESERPVLLRGRGDPKSVRIHEVFSQRGGRGQAKRARKRRGSAATTSSSLRWS